MIYFCWSHVRLLINMILRTTYSNTWNEIDHDIFNKAITILLFWSVRLPVLIKSHFREDTGTVFGHKTQNILWDAIKTFPQRKEKNITTRYCLKSSKNDLHEMETGTKEQINGKRKNVFKLIWYFKYIKICKSTWINKNKPLLQRRTD